MQPGEEGTQTWSQRSTHTQIMAPNMWRAWHCTQTQEMWMWQKAITDSWTFWHTQHTEQNAGDMTLWQIQGVSRLQATTAGGDFLGFCDQKSSYKHVSDFGRLRSYGRFLIPVHALVWNASNSWCVMYSGYSLANFSQLQTAVLVISTLGWYLRNAA